MGNVRSQVSPPPLDCLSVETRALLLVFDAATLEPRAGNTAARVAFEFGDELPSAGWLGSLIADAPIGIRLRDLRRMTIGTVCRGRLSIRLASKRRLVRLEARLAPPLGEFLIVELTEVVEDEEALSGVEASAKRFRALLEGIADAYYDWHIATDFVEVTAPLDQMLGLEPGGLPRTSIGFRERVHPDDRDEVIAENEAAVAAGAPYVGEYRLRREDGTYVPVVDRGIVIRDEDGRPTHQVGTVRDVTRERQTEQALRDSRELYRTLFTTAANPAYRVDADGTVLDANPAGLELLGVASSSVLGTTLEQHFGKDLTDAVLEALGSQNVLKRETDLHTDDRPRHLLFTIVPCEVGGEAHAFLIGTDVTPLFRDLRGALKESESALRHQAELLDERSAALALALEQLHDDRRELEHTVTRNLEQFVIPTLERTRRSLGLRPEAAQLDALAHSLREISRPLLGLPSNGAPVTEQQTRFTRRETEILTFIRAGKTTAEIAQSLYLSPATVAFHRRSIRRKLGLGRGEPRLDTYFFGS